MLLQVKKASYSYGKHLKKALDEVDLAIEKGTFIGIIGPNGSGKTTLLKAIYQAIHIDSGEIFLEDKPLSCLSNKEIALKLSVVSQQNDIPFDFSIYDIVAMGRAPHKTWLQPDTIEDNAIIVQALKQVGIEKDLNKSFQELSGGEMQRVLIARALAQQADFLILDEPTNHLDIKNQLELFDFIKTLKGTVLAAIHDLNMAALYCDKIYVMSYGKIIQSGTPAQVLTPKLLEEVFGILADVNIHPITKRPYIVYLPNQVIYQKNKKEENNCV